MEYSDRFGLSVALATPFRADLSVDFDKALIHANWCLTNGCNSITLLGSTGEAASVSSAERTTLLSTLTTADITGNQLVTGVFSTDIDSAVGQIRESVSFGSKRILIAPPFYYKQVSDAGLLAWFSAVFDALGNDLPECLIYNLPSQTGVTISPWLVSRLRDRFKHHILGVKDSSSSWQSTEAFLEAHSDITILVGDERLLGPAMANGAQGAISGMANLYPAAA